MNRDATRLALSFVVGFAGLLAASALRVGGLWAFAVYIGLGAIAAVVGRRRIAVLALWAGLLATYPASLGLRLIAFLGENWALYTVVLLIVAGIGFGASLGILRSLDSIRTRSASSIQAEAQQPGE